MMLNALFAALLAFPADGKTAVTYLDKLEVTPLAAGTKDYKIEVPEVPVRQKDGSVKVEPKKPFCIFLPERAVNVAPFANVSVSSKGEKQAGFKPIPGFNEPTSLVDGIVHETRNFEFAKREKPPTENDPEWVALSWKKEISVCGLMVMTGMWEAFPHHDRVQVEAYAGKGDSRIDTAPESWKAVEGEWTAIPKDHRANFRCWRRWTPKDGTFKAQALRIRMNGGGWRLDWKHREVPVPGLGEVAVFSPWTKPEPPKPSRKQGVAEFVFAMPFDGAATIQIRDANGMVVANPVTDVKFKAGRNKAEWDLTDISGKPLLEPGTYSWHGAAIPPLKVEYKYAYYPLGLPEDRRAWKTVDKTGGWLADHDPPRGVVRDGTNMWLNAWAECGDSVVHTDINMKKLWGQDRMWVAVPQEICVDNGRVYGYSQRGWNGSDEEIIRIDPDKGYRSQKVFLKKNPEDKGKHENFFDVSVTGFQVVGDTAFVSIGSENKIYVWDISKGNAAKYRYMTWDTVHTQFDEIKPVAVKEIAIETPGRLRKYRDGKLLCTSGRNVVEIDIATFGVRKLFDTGLEAKILGLGIGDDGTIWVGAGEPLHQVFGFTPLGKPVAKIGKRGKRKLGVWDEHNLEEPAGVEVDALGRLWVAEHTHWEKRVSVWDVKTGECVKSVMGPTQYGGDGCIDPEDETRIFYRGLELKRNPQTGEIKPVNLIYRPDAEELPRFSQGDYPAYCFRAEGKLWFTSFQPPHGHNQCVLWQYDGDRVRAVAAVGGVDTNKMRGKKLRGGIAELVPSIKPEPGMVYAWTDMNGNGKIDAEEVRTKVVKFAGKPIGNIGTGWNWRMNRDFVAATVSDIWKEGHIVYFKPSGRTAQGYPIFEIPDEALDGVKEVQGMMPDSKGNIAVLGRRVASFTPEGKERWIYRNDWPGLHAGHRTTASGKEPGVLIAPTRMWGMVDTEGEAGEVMAFNSNLGCSYLMTAEDGLYLGRVFRDQRVAPITWNMNEIPTPEMLAETSIFDEHFGGTFQRVKGVDGKHHYCYVVGKGHSAVVELTGLDGVKRIAGGTFEVTAEMLAAARRRIAAEAAKKLEVKKYEVMRGKPKADDPQIEKISLGYDEKNLYVYSKWIDTAATFVNKGTNPYELFKTGDTLEVMLRTNPRAGSDPKICTGDVRLLFSEFEGKPVAVLYEYKVRGGNPQGRMAFSSPWRTVHVDRVTVRSEIKVEIVRQGAVVTLTAEVPWKTLGGKAPKGVVKGDVGRVRSDVSGTSAASRTYWSNKNTAIVSDLPSEVMIEPALWGNFIF